MARTVFVQRLDGQGRQVEELEPIMPGEMRQFGNFTNINGVGSKVLVACDEVGGFATVQYQAPVQGTLANVSMHLTGHDPNFTYQDSGDSTRLQLTLVG